MILLKLQLASLSKTKVPNYPMWVDQFMFGKDTKTKSIFTASEILSESHEHGKETCQVLCGTLSLSLSLLNAYMGFWVGVLGTGGRVHWLSVQGEPSSGVFLRRRSKDEPEGVVTSGGCRVQHTHHLLLDSPHWHSVPLAQSSLPS